MFPLFISITGHTVEAFLIIILSFLINELVLPICCFTTCFSLWIFLNWHFHGGYIRLADLSITCAFVLHKASAGKWLISIPALISQQGDESGTSLSPVFISCFIKLYLLTSSNYPTRRHTLSLVTLQFILL